VTATLIVDAETTGLSEHDTILEIAWVICDQDGTERCSFRHRYTKISSVQVIVPDYRGSEEEGVWTIHPTLEPGNPGNGFALRMAEDSGLFDDWLTCPDTEMLHSGTELQRLILDDITEYSAHGEPVHLAGSGVAQFDQPLLRTHCPRLVIPRAHFNGPVHYRTVDMSVTQMALLGQSTTETSSKLINWYMTQADADGTVMAPVVSSAGYAYGRGHDSRSWIADGTTKHRAVPDVARAVILQRALWEYGTQLRKDCGL
jgi:oligoribonuclease (3'-5' exoribonuclease)